MSPFPLPFCWGLPSLCHSCFCLPSCFPIPLPAVSWPVPIAPISISLPNPGNPEKTSRLEVHWWLLGAQNEGPPPPRKGVGRAVRLQPVWPEGSVCAVAWSPPHTPPLAPRTCWAATTPGLGQSKHCHRQPGIFIPRAGRGSNAHRSPCPALPATASPEPTWHQPARGHTADAASTQPGGHWACCPRCQQLH